MATIIDVKKDICCGCGACAQKCPKNAIVMKENVEGFLYPKIDKEKCINCGLCYKICPQVNYKNMVKEIYPKAYAVQNNNSEELLKSSSGGLFSLIANLILEKNGVVFGAAYDNELSINHIKIESIKDLDKLRGSKYVQSNIGEAYKEVQALLNQNIKVLFTGTPCQISGLKSFLMKEYDNLVTCDLVCHGVPSQKIFKKYLTYLSNKFNSKVISYNFRSKNKNGWGLVSEIKTDDLRTRYIDSDFDPYYTNFLSGTIYRESCYKCKYSNLNRVSDITMADYWKVVNVHPELYNNKGCSLMLVNTKKGEEIIESIKEKATIIETDLDNAISGNKNLKKPSDRPEIRNSIYNNIDELSDSEFVKNNLKNNITIKKVLKKITPDFIKNIRKKIIKSRSIKRKRKI